VSGYEWIMPIAVTPFAEYIHARDPYHWINQKLPRVMTPYELQAAIEDQTLEIVAPHHPLAIRVVTYPRP
jgi:hypothetical protein